MSLKTLSKDSFNTLSTITVNDKDYYYYSLDKAAKTIGPVEKLPFSLKVLLENLLRHEDEISITCDHIKAMALWLKNRCSDTEIGFSPARVLMQDFTGVPSIVDLAAMRQAVKAMGKDPSIINPLLSVDLVIDHSVMVDKYGTQNAFKSNVSTEMQRNKERYKFLRWGQEAFDNFRVVPPGTGICHQVNLEYLGKTVWSKDIDDKTFIYPDTLVGTDSHTTMINSLGILGWGVGGIEAEAAMLGQAISMLIPEVVGFKITGVLSEGITATDLVLHVVEMLRNKGVVGKFVEFYGDGLKDLPVADRATIANMAPEYGATCGFFPVDEQTIAYMKLTGRKEEQLKLIEAYTKAQGLWRESGCEPLYTNTLHLNMGDVQSSLAGPKRPQDRVSLQDVKGSFESFVSEQGLTINNNTNSLGSGSVVIAAITSCTNTSNPSVMMAAGLLAKKATEKGLLAKPWVKTSLAPGSKVVTDYLRASGLHEYLDKLGFHLVGYGCTTCIGNSGPLAQEIEKAIIDENLVVASVLSGNRNFEGRIHSLVKTNWLASPPLVVAYALAGNMRIDIFNEPLAKDSNGNAVYLRDIWPSQEEIAKASLSVKTEMFQKEYAQVFDGDKEWKSLKVPQSKVYEWSKESTYIQHPPFFEGFTKEPNAIEDIKDANILALLGDSVTTDHISPAGAINLGSPAGKYLHEKGIKPKDFNSYGSRRGNHEVMMRGTFANVRIKNEMLKDVEGGYTKFIPTSQQMSIYDAAMKYQESQTPLVVIAGKEYGTGSSRDWAAKGTRLLGVKAVIAESFERIHRSNLIGMGVIPLQFPKGVDRKTLQLSGEETLSIKGLDGEIKPKEQLDMMINYPDGKTQNCTVLSRIDTLEEALYFKHGGILDYVIRQLV